MCKQASKQASERKLLPFLGEISKGVFGEVPKNLVKNSQGISAKTPTPVNKTVVR